MGIEFDLVRGRSVVGTWHLTDRLFELGSHNHHLDWEPSIVPRDSNHCSNQSIFNRRALMLHCIFILNCILTGKLCPLLARNTPPKLLVWCSRE